MKSKCEIRDFNGRQYLRISNSKKNIIVIVNDIDKKNINVELFHSYISNLIKIINTKNLNYLERDNSETRDIIYYVYELEIMVEICKIFNIKEFEKFDHELLSLRLKNKYINYDVINKKIIIKQWKFPNMDSSEKMDTYFIENSDFQDIKIKMCRYSDLKFKLLFYLAYKQNILNDLISQIEQELLTWD